MNTAKELATTSLFDGMEPEDLSPFAAIATEVSFGPQDRVYDAGSAGDSFYVIIEGKFRVEVTDENQEVVPVASLKVGSYFGEMEVIGGMGRTAAVVSEEDSRCYRFDAATVLDMLKRNEKVAAHFYRQICRELIRRLQSTTRDMGYFRARAI